MACDDPLFTETASPSDFLLRTILQSENYTTLVQLSETHTALCVSQNPHAEQADVVSSLIDEAIPLVFPPELAEKLWHQINLRGAAFFEVVDHHFTTIEGLMARADGMMVKYRENSGQPLIDYQGDPLLNRTWDAPLGSRKLRRTSPGASWSIFGKETTRPTRRKECRLWTN